jgi:hypothetical protein
MRHAPGGRRASVFLLPSSVFILLVSLLACRGPARPYAALAAQAEPLRAEFNRDIGHVRIVTLVAPT